MIETTKKVSDRDFKVVAGARRDGDVMKVVADPSKSKRVGNEHVQIIVKSAFECYKFP